jgi:hypothetical protein
MRAMRERLKVMCRSAPYGKALCLAFCSRIALWESAVVTIRERNMLAHRSSTQLAAGAAARYARAIFGDRRACDCGVRWLAPLAAFHGSQPSSSSSFADGRACPRNPGGTRNAAGSMPTSPHAAASAGARSPRGRISTVCRPSHSPMIFSSAASAAATSYESCPGSIQAALTRSALLGRSALRSTRATNSSPNRNG